MAPEIEPLKPDTTQVERFSVKTARDLIAKIGKRLGELYKISQERKLTSQDFSEVMGKISWDFYKKLKELKEIDKEVKMREELERLKSKLAEALHFG